MKRNYTFILLFFFFLTSCNSESKNKELIKPTENDASDEKIPNQKVNSNDAEIAEFKKTYIGTGKLNPIDLTDKRYADVNFYCKDTVTKKGWKIEYLVKDDKTKYDDLYIRWSKGEKSGLYCSESTLIMRSYFIPIIDGENDNHIFLKHGCSTSGKAVLVLPKDTKEVAKDYSFVIDYSIKYGKIGYIPERSFSLEKLEIDFVDLLSGKEKSVVFDNICTLSPEEGCIDKIIFEKNKVEIIATLIDHRGDQNEKNIIEKHSIHF